MGRGGSIRSALNLFLFLCRKNDSVKESLAALSDTEMDKQPSYFATCLQHADGATVSGTLQIQGGSEASVHSDKMLSSDNRIRNVFAFFNEKIRSGRKVACDVLIFW